MTTTEHARLSVNARRYLADLLIAELRADIWERRVLPGYETPTAPTPPPNHLVLGGGSVPSLQDAGTLHILSFRAPPLYELAIPPYLVALDERSYEDWTRALAPDEARAFYALLQMRRDARVFVPAYTGYGLTRETTYRTQRGITSEQARLALELLSCCTLWALDMSG